MGAGTSGGAFRHGTMTPSTWKYLSGCGNLGARMPKWSHVTGNGRLAVFSKNTRCSVLHGGSTVDSSATASDQMFVGVPVRMPNGTGGINVTWNLSIGGGTRGVFAGNASLCPHSVSSYTYYNHVVGPITVTSNTSNCYVTAFANVEVGAYLEDLTQGWTYYSSNAYWGLDLTNQSGQYNYTLTETRNYSRPAYYSLNSTRSYANNYSYGPSSSMSGTYSWTFFINGTFLGTDRFEVFTYVNATVQTAEGGFKNAIALADVDMATGSNYADLRPFSIW